MAKRVLTRAPDDPASLVELLAARLSVEPAAARARIAAGSVYVAGRRAGESTPVAVGAKVTVYLTVAAPPPPLRVAYEDDWLVVVDKAAGVPCQAERSQQAAALDAQVQRAFGSATRMMHRLDKEASGLVLFARQGRACAPLQAALAAGAVERRYLAIVDGDLAGAGVIRLRIGRHPHDRRLRAALPESAPAGEPACSHHRALARGRLGERTITAVELQLETGRTHQLRVHLSGIGHPLVGDEAYGGPPFECLCLHAHALALPHPRDAHAVVVRSPCPEPLERLVPGLTTAFT
jgi:23S rRNA pseudouridine1911/1915/1917 synthase